MVKMVKQINEMISFFQINDNLSVVCEIKKKVEAYLSLVLIKLIYYIYVEEQPNMLVGIYHVINES